jgi:Protein of unknown function (DUF1203)
MNSNNFRIEPIPADVLDQIRSTGRDEAGNATSDRVTATIVADGAAVERELTEVLARKDIRVAHVRNVAAGCFNFVAWPVAGSLISGS